MKRVLIALGLVAVPAGVLFYAKRTKAAPYEPTLTPALDATLKQWLDRLDVDNIGQPGHKKPTVADVEGATKFAAELRAAGYPTEADALETVITLASS